MKLTKIVQHQKALAVALLKSLQGGVNLRR